MDNIYLDNSATTRPDKKVIEEISRVHKSAWGNPSSIHSVGQEAALEVDNGRETVAKFLGCDSTEVIFTSGGSESDNLALRGLVGSLKSEVGSNFSNLKPQTSNILPHIITSAAEHHAVLHTVQELEKEGLIEATYLNPDSNGLITSKQVIEAVRDNTILVSLMYVNNETGVVTPIAEIGKILKQVQDDNSRKIYFHTDAVQAAEWLNMNVKDLGVDLLTFTAHKIHGPKGIGVLYAKKGTPIKHQISGGDQEFRLRAGTENVASIAGLAEAIRQVGSRPACKSCALGTAGRESGVGSRVESLRDRLIDEIMKNIPDVIVNGGEALRAPHIANISFLNSEGEAIILNLDFLGIQVSSGSACTSRSLNPSHVLSSMGVPPEKAHGSIRFSLSRETRAEEIDKVIEVMPGIIKKLRDMSPFNKI